MKSSATVFANVVAVGLVVVCGCVQPWKPRLTLPTRYEVVREPLLIHSDFTLATHHRLLEELTARRSDLCRHLALPVSDEPIHVYLFENAEAFNGFMKLYYPGLPPRRAFFVETDTRLAVYAQWGDRVGEDLRHEVTHGYLHAAVPNLPLWLDEGLAEYYEAPRGNQGLNGEHLDWLKSRLEGGSWRPDLARLEQLDPFTDMKQEDYAEAWAWVHFLLQSGPEHREVLQGYLAELRYDGRAEPLSARLQGASGQPDQALIDHVRRLLALGSRQKNAPGATTPAPL